MSDAGLVDEKTGIKFSGGDETLYIKILGTYFRGIPDLCRRISDDAAGDIEDYTIAVHALKSSSRSIGATELGEMAYGCELAGKAGDVSKIAELTPPLLEKLGKVEQFLKERISADERCSGSAEAEKDVKKDRLPGKENVTSLLSELQNDIAAFDSDGAEGMIGRLEEFSWNGDAESIIDECRNDMDCFDYDGVNDCIARLCSMLDISL